MLGLRWMCMHLWMNYQKDCSDIQEKLKIRCLCTKSMESCPLVIPHILAEFHPERVTCIHNFAESLLLNGLSNSAQTFTVGFVKLLSTRPIHIVVWGNFPFKHLFRVARIRLFSKVYKEGSKLAQLISRLTWAYIYTFLFLNTRMCNKENR